MNKQQACEWAENNGVDISYIELTKPEYDQYLKIKQFAEAHKVESMKDKAFTGKVKDWGLPDGTVMECVISYGFPSELIEGDGCIIRQSKDGASWYIGTCTELRSKFKIKSLPTGYEFDGRGQVVNVEPKRYWDGKEPLEVGMIVGCCNVNYQYEALKITSAGGVAVCCIDNMWVGYLTAEQIKPIDTRTDKEKAVDKFLVNRNYAYDVSGALGDFYDYLNGGEDD